MAVLESRDLPESEIDAFLSSAMKESERCDQAWLSMHTATGTAPPPDDDPFKQLSIAHLRLPFGLSRVYLSPSECGLEGTSKSKSAGPLTLSTRSSLSYDLLDLEDSAGALKALKSIRRRLNPRTPQWLLRYLYLDTSLGMVVPRANREGVVSLVHEQDRLLRRTARTIDDAEIRALLKKRLPVLARELCRRLGIHKGQQRIVRAIQDGILEGSKGVLKHLKRSLRVHLILHNLPSFQHNNANERVSFSVEMACALFHLVALVAGHKSTRNLEEHLGRLRVLNRTACSQEAELQIDRLAVAEVPSQRRDIAYRASQLNLIRLSWHGLSPYERERRVKRDRLPLPERG